MFINNSHNILRDSIGHLHTRWVGLVIFGVEVESRDGPRGLSIHRCTVTHFDGFCFQRKRRKKKSRNKRGLETMFPGDVAICLG